MALEHAALGEKIYLGPLESALSGAKTSALVRTDRFELIRLVLEAGSTIPTHSVGGYVSLHCIEGSVVVEAGESIRLRPSDWVCLARKEPHSLKAVEDSSLLLTIYFD